MLSQWIRRRSELRSSVKKQRKKISECTKKPSAFISRDYPLYSSLQYVAPTYYTSLSLTTPHACVCMQVWPLSRRFRTSLCLFMFCFTLIPTKQGKSVSFCARRTLLCEAVRGSLFSRNKNKKLTTYRSWHSVHESPPSWKTFHNDRGRTSVVISKKGLGTGGADEAWPAYSALQGRGEGRGTQTNYRGSS